MCKCCSALILNGRVGSDQGIGKLTCKEKSVVDYIIASPVCFSQVRKFKVEQFCELYSDIHCAVSCEIKRECIPDNSNSVGGEASSMNPCYTRPKWNDEVKNMYAKLIDNDLLRDLENSINEAS